MDVIKGVFENIELTEFESDFIFVDFKMFLVIIVLLVKSLIFLFCFVAVFFSGFKNIIFLLVFVFRLLVRVSLVGSGLRIDEWVLFWFSIFFCFLGLYL